MSAQQMSLFEERRAGNLVQLTPRQAIAAVNWTTAPHNRTETSRAAALEVAPHMNRLELLALRSIIEAGARGRTIYEVHLDTGMRYCTACARINRLAAMGFIADSGGTRPTDTGRAATVWVMRNVPADSRPGEPGERNEELGN